MNAKLPMILSLFLGALSTRAFADDLPMTGKPDKKFAAFDRAMQHSLAIWRPDGMKIVVLLNRDRDESAPAYDNLKPLLDAAATEVMTEASPAPQPRSGGARRGSYR